VRRHTDRRLRIGGHGRAQGQRPIRHHISDWRTAAIFEAALLAALALGSALLLTARRRALGLGT
jgi:hypothetical protein